MSKQIDFICTAEQAGIRLDKVLVLQLSEISRNMIGQLIEQNAVLINGKSVSKSTKPKQGDSISVCIPEPTEIDAQPQPIPLNIVYEDESLLVVNKPKGMVVHPAPGHIEGTLVNALLFHCQGKLSGIGGQLRPGIVHRIDKNTSGLLVVAKNDAAHLCLSQQMAEHTIQRRYQAVAYGKFAQQEGFIEKNIARHPQDRKKMGIAQSGGKYAYTSWRVLQQYQGFAHLELALKTGRTHQIRVHLASIGHAVAGDDVYGPKTVIKKLEGQCLHAKTLGFMHPDTKQWIEFDSPLPEYFTDFLQKLKKG